MKNFSTEPYWFNAANGNVTVNVYLLRTNIWTAYFFIYIHIYMYTYGVQNSGKENEKYRHNNDWKYKNDPLHSIIKRSMDLAY